MWEETGLKVQVRDVVACESNFFKLPFGRGNKQYCNSILIYYICKKIGGKLSIDNFDEYEKRYADMPEWIDLREIEKIKFYNSVRSVKIINRAVEIIK